MADETYREYLAVRVLTENRPVTYRLLSRALQVHVNVAKQMLFEFHAKQNAKKAKSVHATYLLTGRRRIIETPNGTGKLDGDDTVMRSSPPMSSMPMTEEDEPVEEPIPRTSIVLVREEELEKVRGTFEEVTSIHVYSIEPGPIEDLHLLSVCNQEVATDHAREDPLERWRVYGSVHNPYVKRRTTKYTPAAVTGPAKLTAKAATKPIEVAKPAAASEKKEADATARRTSTSTDGNARRITPQPGAAAPTLKRADSKPGLKRERTAGDLFKSFAKSKPKAANATDSKESTPAPVEDDSMQRMSEDEADVDDKPDVQIDHEKAAAAKKAREEREEKTRKMMEEDVEMPDVPSEPEPEPEPETNDAPLDQTDNSQPVEDEAKVTSQGGRRRGRRRVPKKKTVKDEDGYLVTKEEMVWESFSEDEPEPKRAKPAPKAMAAAKGKKTAGQGGGIASFFKKL